MIALMPVFPASTSLAASAAASLAPVAPATASAISAPVALPGLPSVEDLLVSMASGFAASILAEWAKRWPAIKFITADTKGLIQVLIGVFSLISAVLASWLGGDLAAFDFRAGLEVVFRAVISYASAIQSYHGGVQTAATAVFGPAQGSPSAPPPPQNGAQ